MQTWVNEHIHTHVQDKSMCRGTHADVLEHMQMPTQSTCTNRPMHTDIHTDTSHTHNTRVRTHTHRITQVHRRTHTKHMH